MKKTQEPEVLGPEEQGVQTVDVTNSALQQVTRGEIEAQVDTARKYPRSVTAFVKESTALVTLNEATAGSCIYGLPRGGKTIHGPSARFAEVVRYSWGNLRVQSMVVAEEAEFVTVRAIAWDIEKNVGLGADVKRRITDKNGNRYNSDMIGVTVAAASVIAERNVTLRQIPKALWEPIYLEARRVVAGDAKTLASRRQAMVDHFMKIGVTPAQVFAVLEIQGIEDITLDHMVALRGFATAIKEGDASIDSIFSAPKSDVPSKDVSADILDDYLKDVPEDKAGEIRSAIAAKKLNSAKTAALLKRFVGKPAELHAELTKVEETPAEKPDEVKQPAKETASAPTADEVFGSTEQAKPEAVPVKKAAAAADASF